MSSPFKGDVANVQRMIEGSKEGRKERVLYNIN